jgi:hypothetical protein
MASPSAKKILSVWGNDLQTMSISLIISSHGRSEYSFVLYILQNEHLLKEHPKVTWKMIELASEGGLYRG